MSALRDSTVLRWGLRAAVGPLLVFSIYLLFAGHNRPGGGFAGGLVAGIAISLAWATGGASAVDRLLPVRATTLLGLGLVVAVMTGFGGYVWGDTFGESADWTFSLPAFGEVKLVTALFFDIGVYLVVVGMAAGMIRALGLDEAPIAPEETP